MALFYAVDRLASIVIYIYFFSAWIWHCWLGTWKSVWHVKIEWWDVGNISPLNFYMAATFTDKIVHCTLHLFDDLIVFLQFDKKVASARKHVEKFEGEPNKPPRYA